MKILRKSAANLDQLRARMKIPGEGYEILLLPSQLTKQNLEATYNGLKQFLQETPDEHFGLELSDVSVNSYPYFDDRFLVNPISRYRSVRERSQRCIREISEKIAPLFSGKHLYIQFQATGDRYDPGFMPSKDEKREMCRELSDFARSLEDATGATIMMENQNRMCTSFYFPGGLMYNTVIGTRLGDWSEFKLGFPPVFDTAHDGLDKYTIGQGILYPDGVPTEIGRFSINVAEDERGFGEKLAQLIETLDKTGSWFGKRKTEEEIRKLVTDKMIEEMRTYRELLKNGVVHFNNCNFVGVETKDEEGKADFSQDLIDMGRVLSVIKEINPVYMLAEVSEKDYLHPVNQEETLRRIRSMIMGVLLAVSPLLRVPY